MKKKTIWILIPLLVLLLGLGAFGAWKFYDATVDRSGWTETGVYLDFHGDPVSGWQEIEGSRYCFDGNGLPLTGWQELEGKRFYFGSDGAMVTQWQQIDGNRYYFGESGTVKTLWLELDGRRYYLGESGAMVTSWQEIDGSRYYFGEDGALVTGEQTLEGRLFFFREDGTLVTGWQDNRYYLPEGGFALGWQELDGKRYYFDDDGVMYTGWLEQGEDLFYLQSDGTAAVGPVEIDGRLWHFSPKGKQIYLVNDSNLLWEDYAPDIVPADRGYVASVVAEPLERMLSDCRAEGLYPVMISSYRTYWDQRYMYNNLLRDRGNSAKLYCARPNASEHQLGLAVDIVDDTYRTLNASQEYTKTFQWLSEHCWDYGFIVRYPNGSTEITGVAYEPWHYRYVGLETALELKELGITLEEYLGAA